MSARRDARKLSEAEIDDLVEVQADDDAAWEEPIEVHPGAEMALSIPAELAARAAFLAQVHRERGLDAWVARVLRERVELEELAYAEIQHGVAARKSA